MNEKKRTIHLLLCVMKMLLKAKEKGRMRQRSGKKKSVAKSVKNLDKLMFVSNARIQLRECAIRENKRTYFFVCGTKKELLQRNFSKYFDYCVFAVACAHYILQHRAN